MDWSPKLFNFDFKEHRNVILSGVAGISFSIAWWLMIDTDLMNRPLMKENPRYILPLLGGTLSLIVTNFVLPREMPTNDHFYEGSKVCNGKSVICMLFLSFLIAFLSLIGASYILVKDFLIAEKENLWPGFAILFENALVLTANLVLRFGITHDDNW